MIDLMDMFFGFSFVLGFWSSELGLSWPPFPSLYFYATLDHLNKLHKRDARSSAHAGRIFLTWLCLYFGALKKIIADRLINRGANCSILDSPASP